MKPSELFKDDLGIQNIKMAVSTTTAASKILDKYHCITPKISYTVPHILAYGVAGGGKTKRIEAAAELMGCSEAAGTFLRISADSITNFSKFVELLTQKLSWHGYMCNFGKTDHSNCPCQKHVIVDPYSPRAKVQQQLVFLDEIHILSKEEQEKLGLILLDFKYEIQTVTGLRTIYFPRFTFAAATTKPGDLIKPLRTRFGIKISVAQLSDEEMITVVKNMSLQRGLVLEQEVFEIIAKMSQGVPREAENHLNGLFSCWLYNLETLQRGKKCSITKEIAEEYLKVQKFNRDGLSQDQIKVLSFLNSFVTDIKIKGVGVNRICSSLNIDQQRFLDEVEPRLAYKGLITSGGRGREITPKGIRYLESSANSSA